MSFKKVRTKGRRTKIISAAALCSQKRKTAFGIKNNTEYDVNVTRNEY